MKPAKNARARRKPVDYVKKARRLDWEKLAALWERIKARSTPGWAKGKALEHLVLQAFNLSGAKVVWPYSVSLHDQVVEQIDGLVLLDGIACMIEVKDQEGNLNVEPLAKLRNQLMRRPSGMVGSVFSSAGFTDPAKTLAQYMAPHGILLWQGPEIEHLLSERDFSTALRQKYEWLMQHGVPDYDTRAESVL